MTGVRAIPDDLARQRLAQGEQLRELTVKVWLENPHLARQAGQHICEWLWRTETDPQPDTDDRC